jgi:hypothetical protein
MIMVETPQLSYYYKNRVERSLYAKEYYRRRKLQSGAEKKPRKRYRTWKSNQDLINQHKRYLEENQITTVTISFF